MSATRFAMLGGGLPVKSLTIEEFERVLADRVAEVSTPAAAYRAVTWAYRCLMLRANALTAIPYSVMDTSGNDVQFPIPLRQSLWLTEAWLCVTGAAYWLKLRNRVRLLGVQVLNAQTVTVEADAARGVTGFRQSVGAVGKVYSPEDIVYFRLWSPFTDTGPGVAPLQVALEACRLASNANRWAAAFFESAAIPAVILTSDQPLRPQDRDEIRTAWERFVGGLRRAFRTAVLGSGVKPHIIGAPVRDVAMPQLLAQVRQQIAVAFGVPQTLLEDAANFATAREHSVSFWRETVVPQALLIEEALNAQLFAPLGLRFRFRIEEIEALQQDEAQKAQAMVQLVQAGILTTNEARRQLGLEVPEALSPGVAVEMPGEETKAFPGKSVPMEALLYDLTRWREKSKRVGALAEFTSDVLPDELTDAVKFLAQERGDWSAAFSWLRYATKREPDRDAEGRLRRELLKVFRERLDAIIAAMQTSSPTVQDALDALDGLSDELRAVIEPVLVTVVTDAALAGAVEVGLYPDIVAINRLAIEWAASYSYELVRGINETTRQVVSQAVQSFLSTPGMTVGDLRAMLEPTFGPVRAEMIAITEVTRANAQSTTILQSLFREWGVEMARVWRTSHDDVVCLACKPNEGKAEWDWTWPDGPPQHPRCRCWTTLEMRRR